MAVDTRTAVWISTAEKMFEIVLGETQNSSQKFRGVSAPAPYKNLAVIRNSKYAPPPNFALAMLIVDFVGVVRGFLGNGN